MSPATPRIEAWVRFLRAHAAVTRELSVRLETGHGLTLNDYEVLLQLYYRKLAIVIPMGLIVSAALIWTVVCLLSEYQGLTLTLAGAAGILRSVRVRPDAEQPKRVGPAQDEPEVGVRLGLHEVDRAQ